MAMDAKDLRAESALAERSSDGGAKFAHGSAALHYERAKPGQEAAAFKLDGQGARPCAVIGPDRVAPPARDAFPKKAPVDPWLGQDPVYRRPPDYPHKVVEYQDPTRNISPRQTFQENMQRIIMPPGYNAVKLNEDPAYASKNAKLHMPAEAKYYDVPYNVNPMSSDQKSSRNADHSVSSMNPLLVKSVPHGWPPGGANVRPLRQYGAPELYQYSDFGSCAGPRPALARHHPGQEDPSQLYPDPYYHEANLRYKPYPNIKERYPQARYEYLGNFPNPYHPPHPYAAHKYELPKSMPSHPYPGYPQGPLKYAERGSEPAMDGYQRSFNQQGNYGVPFRNPVIHPSYRTGPGNNLQNKLHPYPSDGPNKAVSNKLPYDPNTKVHIDYDTTRSKAYPVSENYYLNELSRPYLSKSQIILPNYPPGNIHGGNPHPHPYYLKENIQMKNYEYTHFKNLDPSYMNNSLTKLPMQFSPSALAISPADSNASIETGQTHGTPQDDCGYFSQSSVTSVRSIDSVNRIPMDHYGRPDYRYGPIVRSSPQSKTDPNCNQTSKTKKDIRQFISSWSEGDDENVDNSSNKDTVKTVPADSYSYAKQYDTAKNQEQLYVLGLVNVPSEELSKYEHIQKVSKLPKNIKGYNSLELLNQFEEAIESSNIDKIEPFKRDGQMQNKHMTHKLDALPRAVSPLDVEAKISQSVIHKDVGCNFEIKPCSPKMLNVEVAAPVQTVLNERVIEKVANPLSVKSPVVIQNLDENMDLSLNAKTIKCPLVNTSSSCKMTNRQLLTEPSVIDNLKTNYSLQDLESNSGVCLASLPRLDNDIELSFPEVNQQFINANKTEATTSFTKDLPALDGERPEISSLKNNLASEEFDINYQFSPKSKTDTEREFSRLSKYRKLKKNIPDESEISQARVQATRVDSVIIKNPDNARIQEESSDASYPSSYARKETQEFAINLASQAKNTEAMRQSDTDNKCAMPNKCEEKDNSPINSEMYPKPDNSLHRTISVATSQCSEFDIRSEGIPYRDDFSNRYLDNAALDMPVNLSPQAKYLTHAIEEESNGSKRCNSALSEDKIDSKNYQGIFGDTQKKQEKKCKNDTVHKTFEIFQGSRQENLNETSSSTSQPADSLLQSKTEQDSNSCNSLHSSNNYNDPGSEKQVLNVSCIEETCIAANELSHDKPTVISPNESIMEKVENDKSFDVSADINNLSGSLQEDDTAFDVKIPFTANCQVANAHHVLSSPPRENSFVLQNDETKCEEEFYVPKLKKSKTKFDATRRKRTTKDCASNAQNDTTKTTSKKPKLKLMSKGQAENSARQSILFGPKMTSLNVSLEDDMHKKVMPLDVLDEELSKNTSDGFNEKDSVLKYSDVNASSEINEDHMKQSMTDFGLNDENVNHDMKQEKETISDIVNSESSESTNMNVKILAAIETEKNIPTDNEVPAIKTLTNLDFDISQKSNSETIPETSIVTVANQSKQNDIKAKLETFELTDTSTNPNCQETDKLQNEIEESFQEFKSSNYNNDIPPKSVKSCEKSDNDQNKNEKLNNKNILETFRKELFSSRFQNLLTFDENVCTLTKMTDSECTSLGQDTIHLENSSKTRDLELDMKDKTDVYVDYQRKDYLNVTLNCIDVIEKDDNETKDSELIKSNEIFLNDQSLKNDEINENDDRTKNQHYNPISYLDIEHETSVCIDANNSSKALTKQSDVEKNNETNFNKKTGIDEPIQPQLETSTGNLLSTECSTFQADITKNHTENVQNVIEPPDIKLDNLDEAKRENPDFYEKPRFSLKRSLSDSALDAYGGDADDSTVKRCFMLPKKRNKCYNSNDIDESHLLNIIQNSRRNSISTICNENSISFCILIDDNCIIAEDNFEHEESNFTELQDGSLNEDHVDYTSEEEKSASPSGSKLHEEINLDSSVAECDLEKSWVEDVGCEEVIETEDIAENIVIGEPASSIDSDSSDYESDDGDMGILGDTAVEHTSKVKHFYGDNMCTNDAELVDALYRTPQMDVNKKLMDRESQKNESSTKYYDSDSLETLLAEPVNVCVAQVVEPKIELEKNPSCHQPNNTFSDSKGDDVKSVEGSPNSVPDLRIPINENDVNNIKSGKTSPHYHVNNYLNVSRVDSCESSLDNVINYDQKEDSSYTSSSPEVSSTTSEEKNSSILLKISSYKGSRISEVKDSSLHSRKENSCKFTEKEYLNPTYNNSLSIRKPLITKAAQKYIPPIKEPIPDLRVQLPLPKQSLIKFQKNKESKEEPKLSTRNMCCNNNNLLKKEVPKKIKPKFEDVLKNIDEVQIQKHKEKNKKTKKFVPKVVIKKSENGSHYASTSAKDSFNPDLTGRKWQPWVFIEKNQLIDKMALRNKTMAVFSHRKKTFVLAEKFCKYKSISSAKFIISQPKMNDFPKGNLKYTIKLKHSY